mgnify:CR=1 FL=1
MLHRNKHKNRSKFQTLTIIMAILMAFFTLAGIIMPVVQGMMN